MKTILPDSYWTTLIQTVKSWRREWREYTDEIDCFMLLDKEIEHIKMNLWEDYEKNAKVEGSLEKIFKDRDLKKKSFQHMVPALRNDVFFIQNIMNLLIDEQWKYLKNYDLLYELVDECYEHNVKVWNRAMNNAFQGVKWAVAWI